MNGFTKQTDFKLMVSKQKRWGGGGDKLGAWD